MDHMFSSINQLLLGAFGVVVVFAAVGLAARSKKAQYGEVARMGFVNIMAMVFVAIGLGAIGAAAFGTKVLGALGVS